MASLEELLKGIGTQGFDANALAKAITQGTGLVAYDLEAPSKKLYPVLSPMRNELPRVQDGKGGTAVNWRSVTAIAPGSYQLGVAEGQRNTTYNLSTANSLGTYKGIGLEQSVTFEAQYAGQTFEDMKGLAVLTNLQSMMIGEEKLILGGNTSIALGTTSTPTLQTATTGGSIGATTNVVVSVVYLTDEGIEGSSVAGGVIQGFTRTNADGSQTTSGYGAAAISLSATIQTGAGSTNSVSAVVPLKQGAWGYAWYWGATSGAAQKLGAITTRNSVVITTAAGSGTQAANLSTLSTDWSQDVLAFDGYLSLAAGVGQVVGATSSGAYLNALPSGSTLTSDGAGGVVEIEAMLQDRWDNYRLGMDTLWVNSAEAKTITSIIVANGGAPLLRMQLAAKSDGTVAGGLFVQTYNNKFTGQPMQIRIHPYMPAGTMLAEAHTLPYPVNGVNNVTQVRLRRDYYEIDWVQTSRSYPFGLYMDGFLQNYFGAAYAVISNITAS
jgi:hypothetical protein